MKKSIKVLILSFIILLSLLVEITGFSVSIGSNYAYYVKPLIWFFIGIITIIFFKNDIIPEMKYKKQVDYIVILTTLIYFLVYFIIGYLKGFAYNPYDNSIKGVLSNIWMLVPVLVIREYVRFYMISNCDKKHILWWTLFISLILCLTNINIYKYPMYFENGSSILTFILETFVPQLIISLYLTYISYFCGFKTPIIYILIPELAQYIFPILPNIDWNMLSILNAAIPFFSYIYINYVLNKMDKTYQRKEVKTIGIKSWLCMIAVVVLMILFGVGVFPIQPIVIASDSMYPKIRKGDIVFVLDTDVKDVEVGEIIRYKLENYYVIHRITKIDKTTDGKLQFITKGDNNKSEDFYPVEEHQFDGVIKAKIPFVGYPTLIVNELLKTSTTKKVKVDTGQIE